MNDCELNLMFLGWRSGIDQKTGNPYYQGQFLELENNRPVRLYFPNDSKLKNWKERQDVKLKVHFYVNKDNFWSTKVVE